MHILVKIKRLIISRHVIFTLKAECEMDADGLTRELVFEAILNAPAIYKILRSQEVLTKKAERLFVIKGMTFEGLGIYTKGKIILKEGVQYYYVLISSKTDTSV